MDDEKQLEVQVLPGPRRAATRRVFSTEEKRAIVEETYKPGSSVSLVARQYSLSPSLVELPPANRTGSSGCVKPSVLARGPHVQASMRMDLVVIVDPCGELLHDGLGI